MTTEEGRAKLKARLRIPSKEVEFDEDLVDYLTTSVDRLYPFITKEVTDTTVVISDPDYKFTLPTTIDSIRFVHDGADQRISDFIQHDRTVIINADKFDYGTLTIYGNAKYTLDTLDSWLKLPVIWYAMSEFYDSLIGDARKYNIYMQTGARQVDNMRDLADFYEEKANSYLQDRGTLVGHE